MRKWHYYARKETDEGYNSGYWSENPPHMTTDYMIAYVHADKKPTGLPWNGRIRSPDKKRMPSNG